MPVDALFFYFFFKNMVVLGLRCLGKRKKVGGCLVQREMMTG